MPANRAAKNVISQDLKFKINRIRSFICQETNKRPVVSLLNSKLNCCNALLFGIKSQHEVFANSTDLCSQMFFFFFFYFFFPSENITPSLLMSIGCHLREGLGSKHRL